jgi:hypothetical protein
VVLLAKLLVISHLLKCQFCQIKIFMKLLCIITVGAVVNNLFRLILYVEVVQIFVSIMSRLKSVARFDC